MPFARISIKKGQNSSKKRAISQAIHRAVVDTFQIPADDYFHVIHEHQADEFFYDPKHFGVQRSDALIFVQLMVRCGRSDAMKKDLFRTVAANLGADVGIRPEDVYIVLMENNFSDWSVGHGKASMEIAFKAFE